MSDHIPFELQLEIMKRLPVKSLLRFRSVCQSYKSLIHSSDFIKHYINQHQHQHLHVDYFNYYNYEPKYVSFVDHDHTFPHHKVSVTFPEMVKKMLQYPRVISTSHGLLCFYCATTCMAVIWNIALRKTVAVVVPTLDNKMFQTVLGFGVCRQTSDPKIVKVRYAYRFRSSGMENHVEVFTLSTGGWRSSYGTNLPRNSIHFYCNNALFLDGVFYWHASDRITIDGVTNYSNLIISFDMTSEEFREITLPDGLSDINSRFSMSNLGNSLVVCECVKHVVSQTHMCVWMMGDGVSKSFTKLFTITLYGAATLLGFRTSGEAIIAIRKIHECRLAVYEPHSKHINFIGIGATELIFEVYPYMETIFLLDEPDNMVYK